MFEHLKTLLLSLLVLLSILLTWKLWTFQPNYELIAEEPQYLKEISIGKKLDLTDVYQPTKLIFHIDGKDYGTEKTSKIAPLYRDMQNWNLQSLSIVPKRLVNFTALTSIDESIEVIFPAPLSADIIRSLFKLNEEQFTLENIERIVIASKKHSRINETKIYFISITEQQVVEAAVANLPFTSVKENYLNDAHLQTPYYKFKLNTSREFGKLLYLADVNLTLKAVTYTANKLQAEEQLKDVLFNDPDFVRQTQTGISEKTYTDGKRALEFLYELNMMKYINPVQKHQQNGEKGKVIRQSYNFINAHSGWTNRYLYHKWNEDKEAVTFRQYLNNYPVFATRLAHKQSDLATIYISWREGQVYEYIRPLITIEKELIENSEVTLVRGSQLVDHLEYLGEVQEINPLLLRDITIGYQMFIINTNVIFLKPSWFINYNGEWQAMQFNPQLEEGEDTDGLE